MNRAAGTRRVDSLVGGKFRRRKDGKQETRWVYDRNYGLEICWRDRWRGQHVTPWEEFREWLEDAVRVDGEEEME